MLEALVAGGVLPRRLLHGGGCTPAAARSAWRKARSASDLRLLALLFLDGRLPHFPGWGARATDEETDRLLAPLRAAVRAGLLPVASQDGGSTRRAFVLGFADPRLAARLVRSAGRAGLRAWSYARSDACLPALEAGWEQGRAVLVVGANAFDDELRLFGAAGARHLRGARYVVLADPRRARSRRLWRLLEGLEAR